MTIVNIRGTSGSGKSTLVHQLLAEEAKIPIMATFGEWKKPKIVGYELSAWHREKPTFVIGRYETQCGGCDSLSYKGSHEDIEAMVREYATKGNVVFEGLTISSTITRWRRISEDFPGQFVWVFMTTPEEVCHQRILARSGREPKRDAKGIADYQLKYRACMRHMNTLIADGERVLQLDSMEDSYARFKAVLQ